MHRPVMINHTIYEASGADSEGYCVYSISEYPGEGENFEWFVTDLEPLLSKNKPFQGCQEKIQSELSFWLLNWKLPNFGDQFYCPSL